MTPEPTADVPVVSLVTFARNEQQNLPLLYQSIVSAMRDVGLSWEFIIVDDHSPDGTFDCISELAARDARVRGVRLSRNFGSHAARCCGMHNARGASAITLAADLQDPPAIIPEMIAQWRQGAQIVSGVRATRASESVSVRVFSRLYRGMLHGILARPDGVQEITGYCLLDRKVIDASRRFSETNSNSLALLQWMGFRTAQVEYDQGARAHGRSNWTFKQKVKLMVDSITAFSFAPIRLMTYTGGVVFLLGIAAAVFATSVAGARHESSPWVIILSVVLLLGGMQMSMMGILGEYLWRTLVDSRRRPQYLIEETVGFPAGATRQTDCQDD
jgi:polyisoprenyl-phosphate glycosyltransferase